MDEHKAVIKQEGIDRFIISCLHCDFLRTSDSLFLYEEGLADEIAKEHVKKTGHAVRITKKYSITYGTENNSNP